MGVIARWSVRCGRCGEVEGEGGEVLPCLQTMRRTACHSPRALAICSAPSARAHTAVAGAAWASILQLFDASLCFRTP